MNKSYILRCSCLIAGLIFVGHQTFAEPVAGKRRIGVHSVEVTDGVATKINSEGKDKILSLQRVADSLGQQLIDRVHNTRKFDVVSRSDLNTILKDQDLQQFLTNPSDGNIAQAFMIAGCKYALIVTIDDFQDVNETLKFEGQQARAHKRTVRLSSVGKIYDTTSGLLLESANFQLSETGGTKIQAGTQRDSGHADGLLTGMAREMAHQIANRVADVIFPAKIISKIGRQVSINRGDGTNIALGQVWTVYAVGDKQIDPDTKEFLGYDEIPVGKVRISNITPMVSYAEIIEDFGVDKDQILRLSELSPN
ncbi:MAG TPA: hypothetical protein PKE55_08185 [Kiritimatiellia bacterium]|nr:hypothetical protein [Kiritimatiellia bacterium]